MAKNPADRFSSSSEPLKKQLRDAFSDVHERLVGSESSVAGLLANQSAVVDGLVAAITAQFSTLFTSADQLVTAIRNADFLSATTATPVTFNVGVEAELLLDAGNNFPFSPTSVVALTRPNNVDDYAFAKVLGWMPSTRKLSIEIFAAEGEAGPHNDVIVEIAAINTLAQRTMQVDVAEKYADILEKHEEMTDAAATIAAAADLLETGPVISVNGKPGVVDLQAHEIPLQGGASSVQAALDGKTTPAAVQVLITAAIDALLAGAPGALDTLNELATALGNDANFAATVTNALALKANQATTYTKTEVEGLRGALQVDEYVGSATWNKHPLAKIIMSELEAAGGGGGSGAKLAQNSNRYGGGGGAGGERTVRFFLASEVGSTESVGIGAGGPGGASQTVTGDGNNGTDGGDTTFGALLRALGGMAGQRGRNIQGLGGSALRYDTHGTDPTSIMGSGGSGNTGATAGKGGNSVNGGAGGGAGAGIAASTSTGNIAGGDAGKRDHKTNVAGGTALTGAGVAGVAGAAGQDGVNPGDGGSGGGAISTASNQSGFNGGNGNRGGGGGGGGAATGTGNSGAGGNGGDGWARVTQW